MESDKIHLRHFLEINLAMLFISTSGALGRYVTLSAPVTIGVRALLAFLLLFLYCKWKKVSFKIKKEDRLLVLLSCVLICVHWVTYFYALKWSNVAVGMLSMFTYPVITSFLEPLILKTKFQKIHLVLGALLLVGVYLLVPNFSFEDQYGLAVVMGVFSALCYALRNILMKPKVSLYNGSALMCYQTGVTALILLPAVILVDFDVISTQWKGLLALALITTAIGHTLFLKSFKHFTVTTASILSSVQPVFGIIIGAFLLHEIPTTTTIIGGALILASVVIESVRSKAKD